MKAFALVVIGVALLVLALGGFARPDDKDKKATAKKTMKVGNRPGEIGKRMDIDKAAAEKGHELATFAAGCFWGVEERFRQIPGVVATAVGYTDGRVKNPTYKQVCYEDTGHAEAVLIEFDPKKVSYDELVDIFYKNHNPCTMNSQGPDVGDQYRSAIYYRNAKQEAAAKAITKKLNETKFGGKIVTQISAAQPFYVAEDYHQQYCEKNGIAACPIR
jgi:peptide-methionine (S)-S-oxide reductase